MSTTALHSTPAARTPALARVAAGIALPLGLMNVAGAIVFWEWSWLTWVAVWAALMGAATIGGAVATLAGRAGGLRLLRAAMISQLVFTAMKLVFWQEVEAATFGAVAAILVVMIRPRG
jgi:hypothetical protein